MIAGRSRGIARTMITLVATNGNQNAGYAREGATIQKAGYVTDQRPTSVTKNVRLLVLRKKECK